MPLRTRICDLEAFARAGLEPLPMPFQPMVAMPVLAAAHAAGRADVAPGFAGQGIGMIGAGRPAAEVLERSCEAPRRRWPPPRLS